MRLALLLFVASVAGCGTDLSVSEAQHEGTTAYCAKAFECRTTFPAGDAAFVQLFGSSESACVTNATAQSQAAKYQVSIDAGRIIYHADQATVCVDSIHALTCTAQWATSATAPAGCNETFVGTVPNGGACTLNDDCAIDGAVCAPTTMICSAG